MDDTIATIAPIDTDADTDATEEFEPVRSIEPVSQGQLNVLIRNVGWLAALVAGLHEVDISRGRGVLQGEHDRCLWTHDGHRITVAWPDDSIILSLSKGVDPNAPAPEVQA